MIRPRWVALAAALCTTALSTAAFAATPLKATLISPDPDPRLERSRLERAFLGHTGGPAIEGLQVALDEAQFELDAADAAIALTPRPAQILRQRAWRLGTAESCTGGLIAGACTAVPGSSDWFEGGIISYSNAAKTELLGVSAALIEQHGAVSEEVVTAMATGALQRLCVQRVVAVTGIAGPGGATPGKPIGTVWLAVACRANPADATQVRARLLCLGGDRATVRRQTVMQALRAVIGSL